MEPELESFLVLVFRPPDRAVFSKAVYKAARTLFCHRTVKVSESAAGETHCRGDRQSNCYIKYELDSMWNSIQSQVRPTGIEENEEKHGNMCIDRTMHMSYTRMQIGDNI